LVVGSNPTARAGLKKDTNESDWVHTRDVQ
jgi:hypothetical protein